MAAESAPVALARKSLQHYLANREYIETPAGLPDELAGVKRVRTYEEEGVLTRDAGLVVTTAEGAEFQLTIVRSR